MASENTNKKQKTEINCVESKLGDLDIVEVKLGSSDASIKVAKLGATLFSYIDGKGEERLFFSKSAVLDGSKPLRGGVPLVFPQFGDGPLTKHGFARTTIWEMIGSPCVSDDGNGMVKFGMASSEATEKEWPHQFALEYTITFNESRLRTDLQVKNTGKGEFKFQMLLHTYYKIADIADVQVSGLRGLEYLDQLQERKKLKEEREFVSVGEENDAIYTDSKDPICVKSKADIVKISTEFKRASDADTVDAVFWNPWIDKSKRMGDFGDDEYKNMLCVEPGCVSRYADCPAGETYTLSQDISFAKL